MTNSYYKDIIFSLILSLFFCGNTWAGNLSTIIAIGAASTGHVTRKDANKGQIKQADQKYTQPRKGESPRLHSNRVRANLNNPAVQAEYRQAGAISVYNPAENREKMVISSPAEIGTPAKDGTIKVGYYPKGELEGASKEIIVHTNSKTYREAHAKRSLKSTIFIRMNEDESDPHLPKGFFKPDDSSMHIYIAFFHPKIVDHEFLHFLDHKYGATLAPGEINMRSGILITAGSAPTYLQADLAKLIKTVKATGDPELIASFNSMLYHFAFDYGQDNIGTGKKIRISSEELQKFLIKPAARSVGNSVATEIFAWNMLAKYPEWHYDKLRPLSPQEQPLFRKNPDAPATYPIIKAFLMAAHGNADVQGLLSKHNWLSPSASNFKRFYEHHSTRTTYAGFSRIQE